MRAGTGKYKLGDGAGKYKLRVEAGKYKLRAGAGKCKLKSGGWETQYPMMKRDFNKVAKQLY